MNNVVTKQFKVGGTSLEKPAGPAETTVKLLKKIRERLSEKLLGWFFTLLYAPREVCEDITTNNVKVQEIDLAEGNQAHRYKVYEIPQGQLFTNRVSCIAVSRKRSLIPGASWHWADGAVMHPSTNPALTKGTPRPVACYQGNLVSLLTGGGGNYNYYHWLYDVLPRIRLCEYLVDLEHIDYFLVPELSHHFQLATLDLLNLSRSKLISSDATPHLRAENLIVTEHPNPNPSNLPRWIVDWLRAKFLPEASKLKETLNQDFNSRIYIERGDSVNKRRLLNEAEVVDFLENSGFSSYRLSQLSVLEQICLFSNAEIVVGVHGAGFANLAFSPRKAKVLEIFSKDYQPRMYERISSCNGLHYAPIVSRDVELNEPPQKASFAVSLVELGKHLEACI